MFFVKYDLCLIKSNVVWNYKLLKIIFHKEKTNTKFSIHYLTFGT